MLKRAKDEFAKRESVHYRAAKFGGYWYRVQRGKRKIWVLKEELLPTDVKLRKGKPNASPPHFPDFSRTPIRAHRR